MENQGAFSQGSGEPSGLGLDAAAKEDVGGEVELEIVRGGS